MIARMSIKVKGQREARALKLRKEKVKKVTISS